MAANLTEDSIVEHKFVVSLDEIKMDIDQPVECIIKYEYNLFCSYEVRTQPFSLHQEDSNFQAIPSVTLNKTFSFQLQKSKII